MDFMLMLYEGAEDWAQRDDPQRAEAYYAGWMAYMGALRQSGCVKGGAGLQPPRTGTTVRVADGRRQVQDGPFADTKEQLGGFVVIDVPNLDAALEWAARAPCAATGVEVRPLLPPISGTTGAAAG